MWKDSRENASAVSIPLKEEEGGGGGGGGGQGNKIVLCSNRSGRHEHSIAEITCKETARNERGTEGKREPERDATCRFPFLPSTKRGHEEEVATFFLKFRARNPFLEVRCLLDPDKLTPRSKNQPNYLPTIFTYHVVLRDVGPIKTRFINKLKEWSNKVSRLSVSPHSL